MMAVMSILVIGPIGVAIMGHVRSVLRGDDEPDPIWKGVVQGQFALHYGTRAPAYFLMSGRYNGGMSNPTMGAIDDLVRSGAQLERSLWSGDEDRIGRATERMVAATLRPIGAPYWTPKGWVDTAINIPELLD